MKAVFIAICCVICILCVLLMLNINKLQKKSSIILRVIFGVIVGIGISCLIYNVITFNQRLYNNGECSCGGKYEIFDIEQTRYSNDYYYKCSNCNKIIHLDGYYY